MDSAEVNSRLLERYSEVCQYLLPNGQEKGSHYVVGGLSGEPGQSLQITLTGAAAGRFKDHQSGEGGATPLWLWKAVKSISYAQAVKEAKEWLGIIDDNYGVKKYAQKEWAHPTHNDTSDLRPPEPNTRVMDYLCCERRLDPIVVAKARIQESWDGDWVIFPYFEPGAKEAHHFKRLHLTRVNGKKNMVTSAGTKRGLYGKHLITDDTHELIISEGEIDALSFHSWGLSAVSVPNGANDFVWIDVDWEWLERFEKIYVAMDQDEPGKLAAAEICRKLGLHRCFIVKLPRKDANDCLCANITRDQVLKCLEEAKPIELAEIKHPNDFKAEVIALHRTDWTKFGWDTPWYPSLPWRVRKSEFTVLTGFSGHGKTPALNQLMLHLLSQGCKVMDASLEVKPAMTLYDMTKCALAKPNLTDEEVEACVSWLNDSMFFLDCIGTVSTKQLLNAFEYAKKRHGIDIFVIDSLFKVGISSEDYGGQREFADKLTTFCNNTGAHVFLVAHTRKTQNGNESQVPTKSDVAGSSDLVNAAFNVIVWWRNKLKKRKLDELHQSPMPDLEEIEKWHDQPDNRVVLDKQKFGGGTEAEVKMWFSGDSNQFHPVKGRKFPYFIMK